MAKQREKHGGRKASIKQRKTMKSSCKRRTTATKTVPKTATKTTEPGSASQIAGQLPRALEKIRKVHRETFPDAWHRRI